MSQIRGRWQRIRLSPQKRPLTFDRCALLHITESERASEREGERERERKGVVPRAGARVGGDPGRLTKAAVRNITVAIAFLLLLGSPPVLAAVDEFGERSDRAVAEVRANIAAYGRSPIIVQYSVPVPTLQQGDTAERQRNDGEKVEGHARVAI